MTPEAKHVLALRLVVAAILFPCAARAQEVLGGLEGLVTDSSGSPQADLRIELLGTAFRSTTDAAGRYRLDHAPAGIHF